MSSASNKIISTEWSTDLEGIIHDINDEAHGKDYEIIQMELHHIQSTITGKTLYLLIALISRTRYPLDDRDIYNAKKEERVKTIGVNQKQLGE